MHWHILDWYRWGARNLCLRPPPRYHDPATAKTILRWWSTFLWRQGQHQPVTMHRSQLRIGRMVKLQLHNGVGSITWTFFQCGRLATTVASQGREVRFEIVNYFILSFSLSSHEKLLYLPAILVNFIVAFGWEFVDPVGLAGNAPALASFRVTAVGATDIGGSLKVGEGRHRRSCEMMIHIRHLSTPKRRLWLNCS